MQWRTIDGVSLDPLGEFNELETLVRGALAQWLLDNSAAWCGLLPRSSGPFDKVRNFRRFELYWLK